MCMSALYIPTSLTLLFFTGSLAITTRDKGQCLMPIHTARAIYEVTPGCAIKPEDRVVAEGAAVSNLCELIVTCEVGYVMSQSNTSRTSSSMKCINSTWHPLPSSSNLKCRECDCHPLGTDLTVGPCRDYKGQCACLPHVIGKTCDSCQENYWDIGPGGCKDCECDSGSTSMQCGLLNGKCPCKYGYYGQQCSRCIDNFEWNTNGGCVQKITPLTAASEAVNSIPSKPSNVTRPPPSEPAIVTGCSLPQDINQRMFCHYDCPECSLDPYSGCSYPNRSRDIEAIRVQCNPGYGLNNNQDYTVAVCIDEKWVPDLPECRKVCPPLVSDSLDINCYYGTTKVNCKRPMVPGTTANYRCRQSHQEYPSLTSAGIYRRTINCRRDGGWSGLLPECDPICGVSKGNATLSPTIVDGKDTKLGEFPWHAGLYRRNADVKDNWDHICGGSLISNRVVLTASHCVVLLAPEDLQIALGKYYRSWAHQESDAVKREVTTIKMPPEYKGSATSFTWDIALILMSKPVQFNSLVMPVCRNIGSHFRLTKRNVAYVVGWGKIAPDGRESETLLHNRISIIDDDDCRRRIPDLLTFDKFCGAKQPVSIVQKGDSGGGLTAVFDRQHYIFGIVSIKWGELSMFTNTSWESHKTWLDTEMANFERLY